MSSREEYTPKQEESHPSPEQEESRRGSNRKEKKSAKKRKRAEEDHRLGMGHTLSVLRQPDLPGFNLTSTSTTEENKADSPEWTTIENGRPVKKAKKTPKSDSSNYPAITFSPDSRLNSSIKISDLQNLVLYLQADGTAPQFVSVRHRPQFRKVVVLMVPGLEKDMFISKKAENGSQNKRDANSTPDNYYPAKLSLQDLPKELEDFKEMFEHVWPVQTPGDDKYNRMHSPLHAMLTAPAQRDKEDKKKAGSKPVKEQGFTNERTRITEYLCSIADLEENEYVLHPAMYDDEEERALLIERRKKAGTSQADGWVDTHVSKFGDGSIPEMDIEQGSLTAGRTILAMDCEMCETAYKELALTRISIVAWDGTVVMDELVKPAKPITDYVTQFSGITKDMLENVTTTLEDIQQKLVTLLNPHTILLGHSLNSDLTALKLTHPYIIDTALIYPHPRGAPLKQSLKYLAQKFLNRAVQKGHGNAGAGGGHDSIEDSRTCLDLVKQKCEKGKKWGINETGENLFKRLARSAVKYKNQGGSAVVSGEVGGKTSAAVDWGDPKKGAGSAATFVIGCQNDEEVVEGIRRSVLGDVDGKEIPGGGVDFVWGRMRQLESLKGWWNENKSKQNGLTVNGAVPETILPETIPADPSTEPLSSADTIPSLTQPVDTATEPIPSTDTIHSVAQPANETAITEATAKLTLQIRTIHNFLPPCTALIVYSGSGDPREMSRLQQMYSKWKKEYQFKKWDDLSIKWSDTEEQALKRAARAARSGVGFLCVK